jgi:hypothetical protein
VQRRLTWDCKAAVASVGDYQREVVAYLLEVGPSTSLVDWRVKG